MGRKSPVVAWSEYVALRGFAGFLGCFDVNQNLQTAATIGRLIYDSNPKRRQRAEENVRLSLPNVSAERASQIARQSMAHTFQMFMVDALVTPQLVTPTTWPDFIRLGELKNVLDMFMDGRPLILVTGHCGNWELLGYTLAVIGFPLHAVARPLDNPLINKWLMDLRQGRGIHIITKWNAAPQLQGVMRRGGRVGFIADQNAGDQGLFVPFFGRLASSYKSIGLLAMRYKVPVAIGTAVRQGDRFKYELYCEDIIHPPDWKRQPDPLFYLTARFNRSMEAMIRRTPEQYLWVHRRWKSRPRHERLGRPVPDRLIEKLKALPWMTPSEIDTIVTRSNAASAKIASTQKENG